MPTQVTTSHFKAIRSMPFVMAAQKAQRCSFEDRSTTTVMSGGLNRLLEY